MPGHLDEKGLVRYFAGECTDEEKARIEAWIAEDPVRRREVQVLRQIWEAAGRQPPQRWDLDALWEQIEEQLEPARTRQGRRRDTSRRSSRDPRRKSIRRRRAQRSSSWLFRVAVIALLVAVATVVTMEVFEGSFVSERREAPRMREVTTAVGERARIQLSDGTHVLLGPKSTLTLPEAFAAGVREVGLQGKAYFEVAPDKQRPFIVQAGEATARVVGTIFTAQAYPGDDDVQLVVAEGKVAMRSERAEEEEGVVLTRGQMGYLSEETRRVVRRAADVSRQLAWTKGRLVFSDAPFEEVVEELERWYGLKVRLAEPSMRVDRLNARFVGEPVGVVLDVIARTLGLHYERDGQVVTFSSTADSP